MWLVQDEEESWVGSLLASSCGFNDVPKFSS